MGLISQEVQVRINSKNVKRFESLGYEIPKRKSLKNNKMIYAIGEFLTVRVEDLAKTSRVRVECQCDYCGAIITPQYQEYYRIINQIIPKIACSKCGHKKHSEILMIKYGVSNISQIPGITEKKYQTNYSKYGMLYVQTEECKQKIMETDMQKYGTPHHALNEEVRQKQIETNILKFGTPNPFGNVKIQEKSRRTKYQKGLVPTSRQQRYICDLYNMVLNYPINKWNVDIIDLKNKLAIEYDGGGHFLQVEFGSMTMEEFEQKERVREIMIRREGYKMIRIISLTDKLPTDEILLQMLADEKQYFKDFPEHSWINFDIDNGIVRNAEHKEGVLYTFGQLRKIKQPA